MAISKFKTKKGTIRYRVQLCINRKRASKVFDTNLDAAIWQDETERLLKGGVSIGDRVAPGDMLWSDAADRFITETRKSVAQSQTTSYGYAALQLGKSFGKKKMSEVTHEDVAAHMLKRMTVDEVGPSSIRIELAFVRSVYAKAVEWGVKFSSPELDIKRPKAKMKSREDRLDRIISIDELNAIFTEAKKRENNLYHYLLFLLYTGMRPSEAAELYWKRLPAREEKEPIRNMMSVGYVDLARGGFSKVGTKTEQRFVPAHPVAIKIIETMRETAPKEQRMVFLPNKYLGSDRAYRYYRRTMRTTLNNAVVAGEKLRKDISFYSFRHTARSAMEACGIQTAVAETIIGHNDRSFKFTYIHLSDEDLVREIGKLQFLGIG